MFLRLSIVLLILPQSLTSKYHGIIEDYRKLKSDYEEARESREKYKKQIRERGRNVGTTKDHDRNGKPFVLVLVDGDGYIVKSHSHRNKEKLTPYSSKKI